MALAPELFTPTGGSAGPNYTLGRGKLYFARRDAGAAALPKNYRFFGNTPEFALNLEPETLEHVNSTAGLRTVDATVLLTQGLGGTFTADDVQSENLALFFFGTAAAVMQAATDFSAAGEDMGVLSIGDVFQLGVSANRPQGVQNIEAGLVIGSDQNDPAQGVLDAGNYRLDSKAGTVEIIADPGAVALYAFYETMVQTRNQVIPGTSAIRGGLKFVQDNAHGINRVYTFPEVEMRGNGDITLIGDEWQTIPMTFTASKHASADEVMYVDSI